MKKSFFAAFLAGIMLLTGCGEENQKAPVYTSGELYTGDYVEADDRPADIIECETDTAYRLEELADIKTHTTAPFGVCIYNEQIIICDKKENKLVILDTDFHFVKEITTFAPNEDVISEPTGITVFEDKLYLLDAGNNRILILNSDFVIQDTIQLTFLNHYAGGVRYVDLAVDKNGIIYVTNDSSSKMDASVLVVENGECKKAEGTLNGFLGVYNGEVYAMDWLELFETKNSLIAQTGASYLYRMNQTEMELIKEMPYKSMPADFVFVKDKLILTSASWNSVFRFSCDNYEVEKELAHFGDEYRDTFYMAPLNETDFIITDARTNTIYYLH